MDGHTMVTPEAKPAAFSGDPSGAAIAGGPQLRGLIDPAGAAVAINAGGGKIPNPRQLFDGLDVVRMFREDEITIGARRDRY